MEDLAKIKDRIAKLLAMAADASSPNEAAIAAGRARSLMDKYQVSEFDVLKKTEADFAVKPAFEKFSDQLDVFKGQLCVAVATYNDCVARYEFQMIQKPKGWVKAKRVTMLGFASDVDLSVQMYARLEQAIIRLRKEWFASEGAPAYSHRLRRNFEDGATAIIAYRLRAMTEERDTKTQSGPALMVIKQAAVAEHFGETKYGKSKARGKFDREGYDALMAGRAAGAKLEIVPQLEEV